jgi:hypothetical protein
MLEPKEYLSDRGLDRTGNPMDGALSFRKVVEKGFEFDARSVNPRPPSLRGFLLLEHLVHIGEVEVFENTLAFIFQKYL